MIKCILIEDEVNVRESLKKILKIIEPTIEVIGETGYVKDAIPLIKELKPDLVFMDIELEDGFSFEILNKLDCIDFSLIFITAYNQFAIKAFKFSALDYLLKPIDPQELKESISKVIDNVNKEKHYQDLIRVFNKNLNNPDKKIILKTAEQQYILKIKDIIRLEADKAYTYFITENQKIMVSKNIKFYQDILGEDFIRCHQSHLVNVNYIKSVLKNGSLCLINGPEIPISSRKRKEILQLIKN